MPPAVDLAVGVPLHAAGRNRDESRPELSIDKHFLETPFYGVRLMRLMPIYQKPNTSKPDTSKPAKGHKTYPYLLDGLRIYRPSKFWCADITYSPMRKGLLCLVAIMDWLTRKVLARRNSNSLEADFCLEAQIEAIHKFRPPEIMYADQGSQTTSVYWTDRLKRAKTKILTDGKARYLDNIFIERLWRPLKYECAYLHAWGTEAKAGVGRWITFYNHLRPCAVHGEQPADVVNFNATRNDQQVQVAAKTSRKSVQVLGSNSLPSFTSGLFRGQFLIESPQVGETLFDICGSRLLIDAPIAGPGPGDRGPARMRTRSDGFEPLSGPKHGRPAQQGRPVMAWQVWW